MSYRLSRDPNHRVQGVPPSIKGKITELIKAADAAAFAGSLRPQHAEEVREDLHTSRMNLEQTIRNEMKKLEKNTNG